MCSAATRFRAECAQDEVRYGSAYPGPAWQGDQREMRAPWLDARSRRLRTAARLVRPRRWYARARNTFAGIELEVTSDGPVPVRADAVRISQVVTNRLGNALRATSSGKVTVSTTHQGKTVTIRVTDTGIGLTKADQERIFERFYRVSPKDTSEGSGIGLTIARNIMRAHDGDLAATSPGLDRGHVYRDDAAGSLNPAGRLRCRRAAGRG